MIFHNLKDRLTITVETPTSTKRRRRSEPAKRKPRAVAVEKPSKPRKRNPPKATPEPRSSKRREPATRTYGIPQGGLFYGTGRDGAPQGYPRLSGVAVKQQEHWDLRNAITHETNNPSPNARGEKYRIKIENVSPMGWSGYVFRWTYATKWTVEHEGTFGYGAVPSVSWVHVTRQDKGTFGRASNYPKIIVEDKGKPSTKDEYDAAFLRRIGVNVLGDDNKMRMTYPDWDNAEVDDDENDPEDGSLADSLADLAGISESELAVANQINEKLESLDDVMHEPIRVYCTKSKSNPYIVRRLVQDCNINNASDRLREYTGAKYSMYRQVGLGPKSRAKYFPKHYGLKWEEFVEKSAFALRKAITAHTQKVERENADKLSIAQSKRSEREARITQARADREARKQAEAERIAKRKAAKQAKREPAPEPKTEVKPKRRFPDSAYAPKTATAPQAPEPSAPTTRPERAPRKTVERMPAAAQATAAMPQPTEPSDAELASVETGIAELKAMLSALAKK